MLIIESSSQEQNEDKLLLSDTIKKPTKLQIRKSQRKNKDMTNHIKAVDLMNHDKHVILEFPVINKFNESLTFKIIVVFFEYIQEEIVEEEDS